MKTDVRMPKYLIALAAILALHSTSFAGDRNVLYLTQTGSGNTISVDQSSADDSQVGGFERIGAPTDVAVTFEAAADPSTAPALQQGTDNSVAIIVTGQGSSVFLQQDNSTDFAPTSNQGSVTVNGDNAFAALSQIGSGNTATLLVDGDASSAALLQNGDLNDAELSVPASDVSATLIQNGNNNSTELNVSAYGNPNVSYTLNGSNVSTTTPVQVFSNGASVSIQQSTF